jgi:hypothetical protein
MAGMRGWLGLAKVAGGLLIGFHVWLFAGQAVDGRLADPWLIGRWAAAALIGAALVALRRSGAGWLDRKSISIWLLAALLHAPAASAGHSFADLSGLPETAATLAVQTAGLAAAALLTAWLAAALRGHNNPARLSWRIAQFQTDDQASSGFHVVGFARPPPAA